MDRVRFLVRGFSTLVAIAAPLHGQASRAATPPDARRPVVDRYTYDMTLPDTGRHLTVAALVHFAAAPTADTVAFDLDDAMRVSEVSFACDSARVPAQFVRAAGLVKVVIPAWRSDAPAVPRIPAECVRIQYDGVPRDGLIISTDAQGRWQAFGDNFPNRARYWLASMDHPSRKAKVTFVVDVPMGRTVVANGALIESGPAGAGRTRFIWREDHPIPTYGMVIAAGAFDMLDLGRTACGFAEGGGCVPQAVWFSPDVRAYQPGQFAHAGDIVEFFSRTIGAYPYEKLGHLQSSTRYGGMENPSAIFYFDQGFRRLNGINESLIAHETAHQWFGDAVTEREWAHLWLSEGFATFLAALWTQHAHGDTAYAREIADMRATVLRSKIVTTNAVIDSVTADPNALLNDNSYPKGGLVLHMLREEIGDSAFFGALRRYYGEHKHGNALTQDLEHAAEAASGRQLGWFFDQWLRKPGWAELYTAFSWDRTTRRITLRVAQDGRFGPYRLTLPVEISDHAGARRVVRVAVKAQASQAIVLPGIFVAAPRSVQCDPSHLLLAVCTAR